jgi:hypothetical protein
VRAPACTFIDDAKQKRFFGKQETAARERILRGNNSAGCCIVPSFIAGPISVEWARQRTVFRREAVQRIGQSSTRYAVANKPIEGRTYRTIPTPYLHVIDSQSGETIALVRLVYTRFTVAIFREAQYEIEIG